ncbi:MAG TPA: ribosome-binding factor A [Patescibacteria group bacterium]|nr:ribosome-binding factor A [Patescibacteria group bacterium]
MSRQPNSKSKTPSIRQRKVNSFLKRLVSDILRDSDLPGITGLVTVTSVATTPDLREAKIWFSALKQDPDAVLAVLNRGLYEIQGRIYEAMTTRIVPKISFHIDTAPAFSEHIDSLIQQLHHENDT